MNQKELMTVVMVLLVVVVGMWRRILRRGRVAVSATHSETKHFQTLVLSDRNLLFDFPGLVFPNFPASKAELICAGILSIDQVRGDPIPPVYARRGSHTGLNF
jgi:hypothetical protein